MRHEVINEEAQMSRWVGTTILGILTAGYFGAIGYQSQGDWRAVLVLFLFIMMFGLTLAISLYHRPHKSGKV